MKYLKIPIERIAILIGHNGETKNKLEEITKIKINIDSKLGEISLDEHNSENPLNLLKIECIIKAIGRGFSPENAFKLLNDAYELYIFDIRDYVGKKDTQIRRLKSRVIGREGKTKRVLEDLTDSKISIYGHTISIIADIFDMDIVKRAIDKLLNGSKHATVYRYVETNMKKLKTKNIF